MPPNNQNPLADSPQGDVTPNNGQIPSAPQVENQLQSQSQTITPRTNPAASSTPQATFSPETVAQSPSPSSEPAPASLSAEQPISQAPSQEANFATQTNPVPVQNAVTPHESHAKRNALVIISVVLALLLAGAAAALYFGDKDDPRTAQTSSAPAVEEEAETPAAVSALSAKPINKSVTSDYGYKITANEIVTGYEPKNKSSEADPVLVKLTVEQVQTPKYTGQSPYPTDFVLIIDGAEVTASQHFSGLQRPEAETAGYKIMETKAAAANAPNAGYIIFGVPKGKSATAIRFKQKEVKFLNGGQTLPAKNLDILLN